MRAGALYLVSAAGIPNYGDDFIASSWLRYLARRYRGGEVWLDAFDPGVAASLLAPSAPAARFTDTLWAITRDLPEGMPYAEIREIIVGRVRDLGTPRQDIALTQLRAAASIHILGGGYLNHIWSPNLGLIAAAAEYRRRFGVRVIATGQGLLPAGEPSPELLEDLAEFAYIESRDAAGAQLFGIPHGLDDAFLGVPDLKRWDDDEPDLVVLLQGDLASEEARDSFRRMTREFLAEHGAPSGEGAAFLEAYPPVDASMWPEFAEEFPAARFVPFQELWSRGLSGHPGQKWLTSRFHAHLLAASTGAAGIAVDIRGDYYGIKHGSLVEAGTGWRLISVTENGPVPAPAIADGFVATASRYARDKRRLANRLYPSPVPIAIGRVGSVVRSNLGRAKRRLGRMLRSGA